MRHPDQGAGVVEQIDKQKDEDDCRHPVSRAPRSRARGRWAEALGGADDPGKTARPAEDVGGGAGNRDDDRTGNRAAFERHHDQKPGRREQCRRCLQIAERDESFRIRGDDPGILQRDDPEKEADPGRDRHLLRARDGIDDPRPDRGHADDQEQDAGQEHRAERHLPGVMQSLDDAVGEIGVHPHARRQRQRIIGEQRHQQGGEGGGEARRDENRAAIHPRIGQDQRVDEDDVGHRQIGRRAGDDLDANWCCRPRRRRGRSLIVYRRGSRAARRRRVSTAEVDPASPG